MGRRVLRFLLAFLVALSLGARRGRVGHLDSSFYSCRGSAPSGCVGRSAQLVTGHTDSVAPTASCVRTMGAWCGRCKMERSI